MNEIPETISLVAYEAEAERHAKNIRRVIVGYILTVIAFAAVLVSLIVR